MLKKTTIAIDEVNQRWLDSMKRAGQTYNDVLDNLRGGNDPTETLEALRRKMRADAELRARQEYQRKVAEYNQLHADDYAASRERMGLNLKVGEMVIPPLARKKEK